MQFVESFKHNLNKPFEGRASRSEYWWFVLWYLIVFVIPYLLLMSTMIGFAQSGLDDTAAMNMFAGAGILLLPVLIGWMFLIYWMALAVICTGMRRLHDTNRSAWWFLVGLIPFVGWIVLIVFYCLKGTEGPNRFGDDPLQPVDTDVFR